MLDHNLYAALSTTENAFYVDPKRWIALCKNVKTVRIFDGYAAPFVVYAGRDIQSMIRTDWIAFDKALKEQGEKAKDKLIREFLGEVEEVGKATKKKDYLEPVQKFIDEVIESIEKHYNQIAVTLNKKDMDEQKQRSKLKWRGSAASLCALFLDLREAKMKKTGDNLLSVRDPQLIQFITDNFDFLGSENEVVEVPTETIKRNIEGKSIAKRIKLDFSQM